MFQPFPDQCQEGVGFDLQVMGGHDRIVDAGSQEFVADGAGEGGAVFAEETAFAREGLDDSLAFQFGVGLRDGVAVHAQLFGQGPDGGQGFPGSQGAGSGGETHLLHDLPVDREAGFEIDLKEHRRAIVNCHRTV